MNEHARTGGAPESQLISICVPVYNGGATIGRLVPAVRAALPQERLEFVLVNDGSRDNSDEVCRELATTRSDVHYICLRKNYGEHNAVMCALNHARGEVVVIIDDDFQNPPDQIGFLVNELREKRLDVVYSRFRRKRHHLLRNLGSWFNDAVATWLLEKPRGLYLSSFKAIARPLVDLIIQYKGPFPYVDGLILRATNRIGAIEVEHAARAEGTSNYTLKKLINLWLNTFINFSTKPLRLISSIGLTAAIGFLILGVYFIIEALLTEQPIGWPTLIVAVLFSGSMQLFFLGLIGEYVGKNYLDQNGTPQWTILDSVSSSNSSASTS